MRSCRLPPLNWVRAFEAAARHRNFTRAAEELGVTQAAVSQQVKALEKRLGIALFHRVHNQLFLTNAGQAWLPKITMGFGVIEGGLVSIQALARHSTLTIRTPSSFSIQWLAPRLHRFHALHPAIDIRVLALGRKADTEGREADIEICKGITAPSGLDCLLLMREEVFPVCSHDLMAEPHGLHGLESLAHQVLLHVSGYREDWPMWLAAAGVRGMVLQSSLHFDQSVTAIQAATCGLGVALGRSALVSGELATGRLVAPFALKLQAEEAYWIACSPDQVRRSDVRAFSEWLLHEANTAQ